jgi:hypothetical protein
LKINKIFNLSNKIIYIAGAGRSGSTLLDITIGNLKNHWSLGELIFYVENGLVSEEYCSCGKKVIECEFWGSVTKNWNEVRKLDNQQFIKIQSDLLRNKRLLINIWFNKFPKTEHLDYTHDLNALYTLLFEYSKAQVLIDSSKNAQYIKQLKKLPFNLTVLQVTRSFSGVLNSTKKEFKINPSEGVERELRPQTFVYTLAIWLIDNFFTWFFSFGTHYKRIKYEDFVTNPLATLSKFESLNETDTEKIKNRGPFYALHLVAGNKLRMSGTIMINTSNEEKWVSNVKSHHKALAKIIDKFY